MGYSEEQWTDDKFREYESEHFDHSTECWLCGEMYSPEVYPGCPYCDPIHIVKRLMDENPALRGDLSEVLDELEMLYNNLDSERRENAK